MALDAADLALGHLHFEHSREEALGRPALAIGGLSHGLPLRTDGRQSQFGEHHRQGCGMCEESIHAHTSLPSNVSKLESAGNSTQTCGAAGTRGANSASSSTRSGSMPASSSWAKRCARAASHAPRIAKSSNPTM